MTTRRHLLKASAAFTQLQRDQPQGLIVNASTAGNIARKTIIEEASKRRLPVVYPNELFPDAGELMSYGVNNAELYCRAARYADKIFKGAKPGDLPIEQPNKFELIINLKAAKAIGVTIPQSLLISADRVIE